MTAISFINAIKKEYKNAIGVGEFQLPLFFDKPVGIGKNAFDKICDQRNYINIFLNTVAILGKKALKDRNVELQKLLFSESVAGMTKEWHKKLPDCCWTIPILYRTDQSVSGKIYEIQAPGSGWGDIPLLVKVFQQSGLTLSSDYTEFADRYVNNIKIATKKSVPSVYHMIDAASAPITIRYLWAITSDKLNYWGISSKTKMDKVDFVIAHSAAALTTSNYFNCYMEKACKDELIFGVAPNLVFDQKAIYLLPFYRSTKQYFSNDIRALFPFTTLIENNGFYDINENFISIDEFSSKTKNERRYYLKYGGPDLCRNWGSRTVYRLDGTDCKKQLEKAKALSKKGEIWLLQEDVSKNEITVASDEIKEISKTLHIKYSAFNGINDQFGIRIMARKEFKVHGQDNTKVGLAIP